MSMNNKYSMFYYDVEFEVRDTEGKQRYGYTRRIKEIYIVDDYVNNISTLINIKFMVSQEDYEMFRRRGEKLDYFLTIKAKDMNTEFALFDDIYLDHMKLKPMNKPNNIYRTDSKKERETSVTPDFNILNYIEITMTFIPIDVYNVSRNVYNNIFKKCTPYNAMSYLLNNVKDRKILLEKPDNGTIYDQIFFPPNNFANSIRFLQQQYGIYATGVSIFFKNHYLYIKNKLNNSKTPSMLNKKSGNVLIKLSRYESDSLNINEEGTKYDPENNYYEYRGLLNTVIFGNEAIVSEELLGNCNTVFSRSLEDISSVNYKNENAVSDEKRKYYENYMNNPMIPIEYFYSTKKPQRVAIAYRVANINMWSLENIFRISITGENLDSEEFIDLRFQVSKNEMLFKANNGDFSLFGTAYLNEV